MADKPDLKPLTADILADILVVDDTIASLRLLTEILRKVGYQVRPADGPQVALESALAHPPSLILLDVRMPDMDGFEVCSRLKQNERTSDVPIIFVSALQDVQDRVRGFEVGGVDFISKPIEESEVLARVKTHLQLRTMQLHLEELVAERTTALTAANQSIRESEAKYRNLVEQAEDGIAVIQDERIVFANRTFAEITGRTFVAILNTPFTEYIPADEVPKIADLYQRRLDEETPSISETTIQHKDGSQVEVEFNAGLTIFDGKPAIQVIIRDITERKLAEAALQTTEEQFRQLVEQSPMSIQVMTPDGRITKVNQAFMALWGISEDTLPEVLAEYNMLEDEEARQRGVMPLIEKAFKGEAVVLPEVEYDAGSTMNALGVNTKASKRWIHPRLYPVRDANGELVSVVEMEEDITERKQAEQQILEYQERLKALASQLTVAEEKERRRIAAELHDNVGQMLAFARTRLASARKISADTKQQAILDDISGTLQTAIEDTQNLVFDLSSPLLNEVGLAAAISEWLEQQIGKRFGLGTEFIEEGSKPALDEDVRAILFRNVRELLTNVVRHADASQVTVRLKNADHKIEVIVEDDGIGFDPGAASHTAARQSGFGLFSIQERMNDMGGTFKIDSEPGRGTKAILSMPLGIG